MDRTSRSPSPPALPLPPAAPAEPSLFSGGDTVAAQNFLQSVQRAAALDGHRQDDAWINDYVSLHLTGEALYVTSLYVM